MVGHAPPPIETPVNNTPPGSADLPPEDIACSQNPSGTSDQRSTLTRTSPRMTGWSRRPVCTSHNSLRQPNTWTQSFLEQVIHERWFQFHLRGSNPACQWLHFRGKAVLQRDTQQEYDHGIVGLWILYLLNKKLKVEGWALWKEAQS